MRKLLKRFGFRRKHRSSQALEESITKYFCRAGTLKDMLDQNARPDRIISWMDKYARAAKRALKKGKKEEFRHAVKLEIEHCLKKIKKARETV